MITEMNSSSTDKKKSSSSSSSVSSKLVELSYEQLQDVCDILKNEQIPLTNKQVLIPFTTRAFIKGQLCPNLINNNNTNEQSVSTDTCVTTTTTTNTTTTSKNELVTVAVQRRLLNDDADNDDTIEKNNTSSNHDNDTIEMIEMTRHQAIKYLNKEMNECKKIYTNDMKKQQQQQQQHLSVSKSDTTVLKKSTTTSQQQHKEISILQPKQSTTELNTLQKTKKSFKETSSNTVNTSNDKRIIHNKNHQTEHQVDDDKNNFFEIREELDDNGNIKTGQAVNVSDQLKYLQKQQQQTQTQQQQPIPVPNTSSSIKLEENEQIDRVVEDIKSSSLSSTRISSDQYTTISKRLDLLAQLEEEEMNTSKQQQQQQREQYDTAVQTTTKKLQGSGWGKGFLNNSTSKSKKNIKIISDKQQQQQQQQQQQTHTQKLNFTRSTTTTTTAANQISLSSQELKANATISAPPSTAESTSSKEDEIEKSSKVVSFANVNQVQEIPRIGHRSFNNEKQQQQQQQQQMGNNIMSATLVGTDSKKDEQQQFPKTFSSDVIAPIVQERKTVKRTIPRKNITSFVTQQQIQQQQPQQSPTSTSSTTYSKVSQFAQQRQQMQLEQIRQTQLQQQQQRQQEKREYH